MITVSSEPSSLATAYRPLVFKVTTDRSGASDHVVTHRINNLIGYTAYALGSNTFIVGDVVELSDFDSSANNGKRNVTSVWQSDGGSIAVTAVADASPNIRLTAVGHSFSTGQIIELTGFTSYDGFYIISATTASTIDVRATFVATETGTATQKGGIVTSNLWNGTFGFDVDSGNVNRANDALQIKADFYKFTSSINSISAVADNGDGTVRVTTGTHGYTTGDVVGHENTTTYDGAYEITVVSTTEYDITATFGATSTGRSIKGTLLASKRQSSVTVDSTAFFNFNASSFAQNELNGQLVDSSVGNIQEGQDESILRYGAYFTEEYDSTAGLLQSQDEQGSSFLRSTQATEQHQQDIDYTDYQAANSSSKFLSNAPTNRTIRDGELAQLSIQANIAAVGDLKPRWEQYDTNGASLGVTNGATVSIKDYVVFPIRSSQIGNNSSVSKVDVWLADSINSQVTEKITFTHAKDCVPNKVRFWWLNLLGGYDQFTFTGDYKETIRSRVTTYEKNLPVSFESVDRGTAVIKNDSYKEIETFSELIPSSRSEWVSELLSSPEVYIESGGELVPIVIITRQAIIKDEGFVQLRIRYVLSNQRISQRG